jgi:hypothetical protein
MLVSPEECLHLTLQDLRHIAGSALSAGYVESPTSCVKMADISSCFPSRLAVPYDSSIQRAVLTAVASYF